MVKKVLAFFLLSILLERNEEIGRTESVRCSMSDPSDLKMYMMMMSSGLTKRQPMTVICVKV